jgi:hypothetical protein
MTGTLLDLQATSHDSRVLGSWLAGRDGAAERLGHAPAPVQAFGENNRQDGLSAEDFASVFGLGTGTAAGMQVTPDAAMRVSTVYACVSLLAGAISSLPIGIFERGAGARQEVEHDYWWMLNEQANEEMTSAAAWEYMVSAKCFYGDGFAELLRLAPTARVSSGGSHTIRCAASRFAILTAPNMSAFSRWSGHHMCGIWRISFRFRAWASMGWSAQVRLPMRRAR